MITTTQASILRQLRTAGEATRPQLAAACGVSLVSINKAAAVLCERGEIAEVGTQPSGGGRPVRVYRLNKRHSHHLLVKISKENNTILCTNELLNLQGEKEAAQEARFGSPDAESLAHPIEQLAEGKRIRSITIRTHADIATGELARHLHAQYNCPVLTPSTAGILAPRKERTATLCLPEAQRATCAYYRHGQLSECGDLALLPGGACWPPANGGDRSIQVEIAARLLQIISCILQPRQIHLYTPPQWDARQHERIRYTTDIKLKGSAPILQFFPLPGAEQQEQQLHTYASTHMS